MSKERKMHLGAFLWGPGHHVGAWRHRNAPVQAGLDLSHYQAMAKTAERGLFDMLFLADSLAARNIENGPETFSRSGYVTHFEPLTLLSALSAVTKHIGLVATMSTSFCQPYHVARMFASLDHLSAGRAGWNVVTSSFDPEAENFGLERHLSHPDRYRRAHEFVDVVTGLWDTWADDAFVQDKDSGIAFDPNGYRRLDHEGEFYRVRGPLNVARPPQGHPLIVQAGGSEDGQELAARTADAVFSNNYTLETAQVFYKSLKERLPNYGRHPESLTIMPGISPIIGKTRSEAKEKAEYLKSLVDPVAGVAFLSRRAGIDLSQYPIDGPLPFLPENNGTSTYAKQMQALAQERHYTIRDLMHTAYGSGRDQFQGTPQDIADQMQDWFENAAADGFNLAFPSLPDELDNFVEHVIPELQRRGLFRQHYGENTLRGHFGLVRPGNKVLNRR